MTKKFLVDADVFIEYFIGRSEFKKYFMKLDEMKHSQQYELYVTSKCLERIHLEHGEDKTDRLEIMVNGVIDIDENIKDEAHECHLVDFDSAEELICARKKGLDAILTLNPQNFGGAALEIISLQALTEKSGDKLRKHLPKVIFSSLALFSIISIAIIKYAQDRRIFKEHISEQNLENECKNPKFYNTQFLNKYNSWIDVNPDYFKSIYLTKDPITRVDNLEEIIPAHRWRCVYVLKSQSELPAGRSGIEALGLVLKEYCEKEYPDYKGRIDARPLHYDNPNSVSCVLTKPKDQ